MKPQIRTIASLIEDGSIVGLQDGNHGGDHPKASEYVADGIPFVMASNIRDGRLNLADCEKLPRERTDRLRIGFAKSGDVLLTHKGTVGEVCITPEVSPYVMLTPQVTYYRVNPEMLDNRYLCAALRSRLFRQQLDQISPQSTRPYVPISTQKGLRIEWRPIEAQRLVAARVAGYEDLIENNTRRIAILEEMARRIFEEWFVHFRAPGCEGQPVIHSPLGPIPKGWNVDRLRDHASVNPEQVSPRHPLNVINYIDIASVTPGSIDATVSLDFAEAPGRARRVVRHGDVIWSCVRPNRRSFALVLNPLADTIASTGFAVLRAGRMPWSYLYLATTTQAFTDYLTNHTTGAAYPAVKADDFEKALILVPPAKALARFSQVIEPMLLLAHTLRKQNANLRAQRDLLLPKLIAGEIDLGAAAPLQQEAAE
jgi:type I restriction enzyme S subunit